MSRRPARCRLKRYKTKIEAGRAIAKLPITPNTIGLVAELCVKHLHPCWHIRNQ